MESEGSFAEWLDEQVEAARDKYKSGPRSENKRGTDIALGKVRAFKTVREEYLKHQAADTTDK